MQIRGARASLARARMIRSAKRSRGSRILNRNFSPNTSFHQTDSIGKNPNTAQAKKIALYEEIQKNADDLQKTIASLRKISESKTDVSSDASAETSEETKKAQEAQKEELSDGIKDFVKQYNAVYENLNKLGGGVNTFFADQMKKLLKGCEEELAKTGVTIEKDGRLSIDKKGLADAQVSVLKEVWGKNSKFADKISEKCKIAGENAASTIEVMNRMYGTQTYNKYGYGNAYFGNSGSWYNARG